MFAQILFSKCPQGLKMPLVEETTYIYTVPDCQLLFITEVTTLFLNRTYVTQSIFVSLLFSGIRQLRFSSQQRKIVHRFNSILGEHRPSTGSSPLRSPYLGRGGGSNRGGQCGHLGQKGQFRWSACVSSASQFGMVLWTLCWWRGTAVQSLHHPQSPYPAQSSLQ